MEGAIANVVVLSITRELAPVLAGLMVAGRIGAGPVAEIDHSGNEYVDQFINGRAEGPIQMEVREL